jgi:hypothetical protein
MAGNSFGEYLNKLALNTLQSYFREYSEKISLIKRVK